MLYREWFLVTYKELSDPIKRTLFSKKDLCDQGHYCLIRDTTCEEVKDEQKWSWWEKKLLIAWNWENQAALFGI